MFLDWTIIILIPGVLLALWAQFKVRSTFQKYSRVPASNGMTGGQVAQDLLRRAGSDIDIQSGTSSAVQALRAVRVEATPGELSDHYDPRTHVLRLSEPVYGSNSLAALGVAAHETGHALQHATNYSALNLRSAIVPLVSIGSNLAWPLFFIGLIFASSGLGFLMNLGILLYIGAVVFALITLPVEFNASRRAIALLQEGGYIRPDEAPATKAVLDAAALTYVAAALMAILTLIRLIILRNERD